MIKDSGERRTFPTGSVRDIQEGKGRCDLLPLKTLDNIYADVVFCFIGDFQETADEQNLRDTILYFIRNEYKDNKYNALLELAKHFEEGAKKYGEYNWQKGIPTHCYIDSAVRHYLKYKAGWTDEPHNLAFLWNLICCIWTCEHKPELNDYAKDSENDV